MPNETLIVARNGPVLKITLNRPEARNAMSPAMLDELTTAFAQARDDSGIRVVVLMGTGGNFCAGGDFRGMQKSDAAQGAGTKATAASNRRFGTLLELIDALPKAVICLIEGACMGGGMGLVAVSDWVIAEREAKLGTPEVTVGIVPAQITPFIVQRIGTAHARRLAAFGLRLGADEAQRTGLVHEIGEGHSDLTAKGVAAVNQCLRCAPGALALTKGLIREAQHAPLGATLDAAAELFANALAGDAKEGIRAFMDKRKPAWVQAIEKL
jgi:isohexenylglutaconyl-CoA hydratase